MYATRDTYTYVKEYAHENFGPSLSTWKKKACETCLHVQM